MLTRLAFTLILALTSVAHPLLHDSDRRDASLVSLPIAKRITFGGSTKLIHHDRHRAANLIEGLLSQFDLLENNASGADEVSATNTLVSYTVQVEIGSPPSTYELIIDTGSSNTWIGARKKWHLTSTSDDTHRPVAVSYGSGSFEGEEVFDKLAMGNLVIEKQSFGVANKSSGFEDVDGILGVGPTGLTEGTTIPKSALIPTVIDTAARDGLIPNRYIGIYFQPPTKNNEVTGVLTFGHADSTKFVGNLYEVPITSNHPASRYVGIEQSITYGSPGDSITILPKTSGIVDSGTTLILLESSAYDAYAKATGATFDKGVGLLSIPADKYDNLKSLYFNIGSETFELIPNAQIWPRSLNKEIGGASNKVYLIIGDLGSTAGALNFICGQVFLERYYTTYDSSNNKFGIAETKYTRYEGN